MAAFDCIIGEKDAFNESLSQKLGIPLISLETRIFKDGEAKPAIATGAQVAGKSVLFTKRPKAFPSFDSNEYFAESLFTIAKLREVHAKRISMLMPYMVYGKQDKVFLDGEAHSLKYMLEALKAAGCKEIITLNAHPCKEEKALKLVRGLKVNNLFVFGVIADYLKQNFQFQNPLVIGPDLKSSKWAGVVAKKLGVKENIIEKKKRDLTTGEVSGGDQINAAGRDVIIVDDMINAGSTMLNAISMCKKSSPKSVLCVATHFIGADNCLSKIRAAGADVIATNTISSEIAKIDVTGFVAAALAR